MEIEDYDVSYISKVVGESIFVASDLMHYNDDPIGFMKSVLGSLDDTDDAGYYIGRITALNDKFWRHECEKNIDLKSSLIKGLSALMSVM